MIRRVRGGLIFSTLPEVRSSTFFILIFPFSLALTIESQTLGHRFSVRYLADDECFVIHLFNLGTYPYGSTAFTVIVLRYINIAACLEIGIELEFFLMQVFYGCVAKFIEVMR